MCSGEVLHRYQASREHPVQEHPVVFEPFFTDPKGHPFPDITKTKIEYLYVTQSWCQI